MNVWQFDPYSALLGAALALALVGLAYTLRGPLVQAWQQVRAALSRLSGQAMAGAEERYRRAVANWAQQAHALARLGPLEQFFVPPELIPPPPHPDPETDTLAIPSPLPLGTALRGHRRLLLIGPPGSGRSTLLAYLALAHARRQEGSLLGLATQRLALYLHLACLDTVGQDSKSADPLSTLVQGAIRTVGGPPTRPLLRQWLQAGNALVLIDGWDELDAAAQQWSAGWLASLADSLPGNLWLVAVGPRGYAPFTSAGFLPLRLKGWERPQVEAFVACCGDLLSAEEDRASLGRVAEGLTRALQNEPTVLDLVLQALLLLKGVDIPSRRTDLFLRTLDWLIDASLEPAAVSSVERGEGADTPTPWFLGPARGVLASLARRMHQEAQTTVTRAALLQAVQENLPPADQAPRRAGALLVRLLTAPGGPLVSLGTDRYAFRHIFWAACLTAQEMADASAEAARGLLDDPRWVPVLDFYAETGQMGAVVEAWLARPDDLWRNRLRTAARWAAAAGPAAPWRNGVMALLARTFLEPALPARVRGRLAQALVWTGDPGVPLFLRQALQHPLEAVRTMAARAMGMLGQRADVAGLARALEDPQEEVRSAAALALGEVGTPAAVQQLAQVLAEGEERLQVEAARGLARAGEAGWKLLREAIEAEDFLTRRAAAYGLGQVKTAWARELLQRRARDDEQWIVRSAAAAALAEEETVRPAPVGPPLAISEMGWLISWAAERGEGVGIGDAAFTPLLAALKEGTAPIRCAAAQALGWAGRPEHVTALWQALSDPDPEVARAALWALEELSCRHDLLVR